MARKFFRKVTISRAWLKIPNISRDVKSSKLRQSCGLSDCKRNLISPGISYYHYFCNYNVLIRNPSQFISKKMANGINLSFSLGTIASTKCHITPFTDNPDICCIRKLLFSTHTAHTHRTALEALL